jgi:PleD family two-component response regulator
MKENGWPVTFSIGAVTFTTPPASITEMIKQADDLMYAAKRDGKDMVKHIEVESAPAVGEGEQL